MQSEEPAEWVVQDFLEELPARASVSLEGRTVQIRAWRYDVTGVSGSKVPVIFLDTDLLDNSPWDRSLSDYLYGGDARYRLCQEALLGIGGVRMLQSLGHGRITRFHMNEGHASLLALELLEEHCRERGAGTVNPDDIEAVRSRCVFTTHTPVPAGHDKFPIELALTAAHEALLEDLRKLEQEAKSLPHQGLAELRGRLDVTRQHIADHFRLEEQNGYMDAVIKREPRLERTIEQLAQEHRELLESLTAIIGEGRTSTS